jgi:hypothetical protein
MRLNKIIKLLKILIVLSIISVVAGLLFPYLMFMLIL